MKKLFISQPMKNKTVEEIKLEKDKIVAECIGKYGELEVIESYFDDAPEDAKPLWYLGMSLILLAEADLVYFADEWEKYKGCRIEHQCAIEYGLNIVRD